MIKKRRKKDPKPRNSKVSYFFFLSVFYPLILIIKVKDGKSNYNQQPSNPDLLRLNPQDRAADESRSRAARQQEQWNVSISAGDPQIGRTHQAGDQDHTGDRQMHQGIPWVLY